MKLWGKIVGNFKQGSMLTRLIYINLGVFIVIRLLMALISLSGNNPDVILDWLALPANTDILLTRPWTLITTMFVHYHFFHIFFNLVALYFFGLMFTRYLNEKRLLAVYIIGGLAGSIAYLIAYNSFTGLIIGNTAASVIGASGAIYAIMVAIVYMAPNMKVYIPLISTVELKWLVFGFIFIDLISISMGANIGGHIAHLGGGLFGLLFAYQHKQGKDITQWFDKLMKWLNGLFKPRQRMHVSYKNTSRKGRPETDMEYNARKKKEQDEINRILDKVSNSGYNSLTKREKELLFKNSNKK
jgi:membrane associated rhomboid family serine protease